MDHEVGIQDEIYHGADSLNHAFVYSACNHAQEDLFHVLILIPCPLGNQGDPFLEVVKAKVTQHALEATVHFTASSIYHLCASADEMVFEDALMELMVDIGGEALVYIAVW